MFWVVFDENIVNISLVTESGVLEQEFLQTGCPTNCIKALNGL